ncbi:MAG: amidohydrolase [Caldilineaceae bacterium SB0675_bin_29]|uniref:Amidohydrolase n=1 Tax=Caldilineaceae bacterium SB0675_bin_29 TaxID=2605266 RepID=A0A6B1G102_9CHLR|nr:amidohydrolase [Caldilineaceae bacterium SB0675_bin_29]
MMIDIHSHIWQRHHWSEMAIAEIEMCYGKTNKWHCPPEEHWEQVAQKVDRAAVFAMNMNAAGLVVPNEYVHDYVSRRPDKLFGVASVDPNDPACIEQLTHAIRNLGLRALKLSGAYQNFNPADTRYDPLYSKAQELDIPIFWHQSTTTFAATPLRWSKPILLDEVAQRFPKLRQMICHIGHPWHTDAVMVMRKHKNVYGDMSGFGFRRLRFYEALATAIEYDVGHKIFFGSDYPFAKVDDSVQYLYDASGMASRAGLSLIPEAYIEDLLQRDSLKLLGID